jgi:arylsulfatase A-like enzyme/Tfp pilus assembly protein PilF
MTANKTGKNLLLIVMLIVLIGAGIWLAGRQGVSATGIRHVVLISLDTTRADHLSCYGYERKTTPNIDALAEQGYLFSNTTTTIPLTLPAHTSMLTGTIPPHHGRHENKDPYFDPSHVTLAQLLKKKGFCTGGFIGSQILNGSFGLDRGFDVYQDLFAEEDQPERRAEEVNRAAFRWLGKQKDDPVFLFLHYYDPHDDYDPPEPFASKFKESPYAGEIAYTDHCIGQVVAKLKELGMYDSSLIIVTGDHGEMLGEHGETTHMYFIYESAIKVPLICKLPGSNSPHRIDDIAGIIDIVPTVCDLLDIAPPEAIEGESLAGYFSDMPPEQTDRYLYCESLLPTKYQVNSLLCLVGNRWKYIQTTRPELYDLQKDPGELTNLADAEPHRARILKDRLSQVIEQSIREEQEHEDTPISGQALMHLRSLGYVAGSSVVEDFSFDQSKEDPKDLIDFHEEYCLTEDLVKQNKLIEIQRAGERLIKRRPDFYEVYDLLLGNCLKQKDYANAVRYGEKALALKPGRFMHFHLGAAYSKNKQYQAAVKQFELVLDIAVNDKTISAANLVNVHNGLGLALAMQKKIDQAVVHFEKSLVLDPKQPITLNSLAKALLFRSDQIPGYSSKALKLANQACILTESKNPEYVNTLAIAYVTVNNFKEAIKTSKQALALAKTSGNKALIAKMQQQLDLIKKAVAESKKIKK